MENFKFRTLSEREIEARVADVKNGYITILLYKTARVDMDILDETFGPFGWQCSYEQQKNSLFCTISVKDTESGNWISKSDCGDESNISEKKGEASDAFKRAAFRWGIGRELYSTPRITFKINEGEGYTTRYYVRSIKWNEDRKCEKLEIVDARGTIRFSYNNGKFQNSQITENESLKMAKAAKMTKDEFTKKLTEAKASGRYNIQRLREFYEFYTSPDKQNPSITKLESFSNFDFDEKLSKWKNVLI